jgi:hypothetical protein
MILFLAVVVLSAPFASVAMSQTRPATRPTTKPSPSPVLTWSRDLHPDTWVATDELGRSLPTHELVGRPRPNRFVGIFYFIWMGSHSTELYDINELLKANPDDPQYGPPGKFHWWGKPLFGYYRSDDRWVIRRHAQMLAAAGVDVMIFDVTNGFTYDPAVLAICEVMTEMRARGEQTPSIAFITWAPTEKVVGHLYETFYKPEKFKDLWFIWKGKPLILANESKMTQEWKDYFTVRTTWFHARPERWWGDGQNKWCWGDIFPQTPGWTESPDKPEQISVSAATHPTGNIGRSHRDGIQPPPHLFASAEGRQFAQQFERALAVAPEFVFITGWNEWVAQRFIDGRAPMFLGKPLPKGGTYFVDQFNHEYSRDLEPLSDAFGDAYYYQMTSFIRRYKGARPIPAAPSDPAMRVNGNFAKWQSVEPEYRSFTNDTTPRSHDGWKDQPRFENRTGRNDLVAAKVVRSSDAVLFHVRTAEPITSPDRGNWMTLLIDSDSDASTGWMGYDLLVNRRRGARTATIERNVDGRWAWQAAGSAEYRVAGNELELAVPMTLFGGGQPVRSFDFKLADNLPDEPEWRDLYTTGDVAPIGRFNWRVVFADE